MLEFINSIKIKTSFLALICIMIFSCNEDEEPLTDITQFPRISAVDSQTSEDEGTLNAKVTLSWPYDQEVSVDYIVQQYEDNTSAEEGQDFMPTQGRLVFAAGETEKSIPVSLITDVVSEPDESFELVISNPVYGKIINISANLTIMNDDTGFFIDDAGTTSPENYPGYDLVWSDEFDGDINPDNWTHEIGGNGWGNNELQYYTDNPSNSFTALGYLVIEAREEPFQGNEYTSARMITAGKQEFQYGRIDIRARLPKGRGIWPALWMLGSNFWDDGWPSCGEIDIMELIGHQPSIIYGTAHYGANPALHDFKGNSSFLAGEDYTDEFHVFSIIWAENSIKWFRDGIEFFALTPTDLDGANWPFNQEFFFIFNIAVGGNWPGNPDETTAFPQRMIVDYIRVFQ